MVADRWILTPPHRLDLCANLPRGLGGPRLEDLATQIAVLGIAGVDKIGCARSRVTWVPAAGLATWVEDGSCAGCSTMSAQGDLTGPTQKGGRPPFCGLTVSVGAGGRGEGKGSRARHGFQR